MVPGQPRSRETIRTETDRPSWPEGVVPNDSPEECAIGAFEHGARDYRMGGLAECVAVIRPPGSGGGTIGPCQVRAPSVGPQETAAENAKGGCWRYRLVSGSLRVGVVPRP